MKRLLILVSFLCLSMFVAFADQSTFEHVKIHRHRASNKRILVDKVGSLVFDDSLRKITFDSHAGDHVEIAYEDVQEAIFEVTSHMRGGALSQIISAASFPGMIAGGAIAGAHVNNYWFYLAYKSQGRDKSVLMEVPRNSSAEVISKAKSVFSGRVTVADFPERAEPARMEDLTALKTKQRVKVDKENHPLPEIKPDQATVVVVCPPLAARYAGTGGQVKLHANDRVVAVNRMGTYSFAYLPPGKYRLVSQEENADGFEMQLEAGHEYFFLQNTFQGAFKGTTELSRNSPELVMYLLDGSYYSDWTPK